MTSEERKGVNLTKKGVNLKFSLNYGVTGVIYYTNRRDLMVTPLEWDRFYTYFHRCKITLTLGCKNSPPFSSLLFSSLLFSVRTKNPSFFPFMVYDVVRKRH